LTFLGEAASEVCPRNNDIALICRKLQRLGARQIGSWLFDLAAVALSGDPDLKSYSGFVEDSGVGRWTMMAARENRSVWGINTTFCRAGGDL
jgi:6-phosphogluconate dehydrogenase